MKSKRLFTHETYLSPFTWRYGSDEMRTIWSDAQKWRLCRQVWVALATAEHEAGLVTDAQLADIRTHRDDIDLVRAAEIESEIHHDLMAQLRCYAEQCSIGGAVLHLGATSADILDNVDALRIRDSLELLIARLGMLLGDLASMIEQYADHMCMGFTHLQPAEPTTVGYRLAGYAQDLIADYGELLGRHSHIMGKGVKGAVGTSASYAQLLEGTGMTPAELEKIVMGELGIGAFPIATQVYPRKQDYHAMTALAGLAASLYRFGFDLRLLQSPPIGEWSEPFGSRQVGSSAMPFKRNPIHAENIDSLARLVVAQERVAWDNAAHCLLERTLDDSANRRSILPEAFLASDEMIGRAHLILRGMSVHDVSTARNLDAYGVFAATERLLMELGRAGADRQAMHEKIRQHSLAAWQVIMRGEPNPLADHLAKDTGILEYLSADRVYELLNPASHVGDAPERARQMAQSVRAVLGQA